MKSEILLLNKSIFLAPSIQVGYYDDKKILWLNLGILCFMWTLLIRVGK